MKWKINTRNLDSATQMQMVENARKSGKEVTFDGLTLEINGISEEEVHQATAFIKARTGKQVRNRKK